MSLFKNLFGKQKKSLPEHKDFKEGDIICTNYLGKYQPYKILIVNDQTSTLHVISYVDVKRLPKPEQVDALDEHLVHIPIEKESLEHPVFVTNTEVTDDDLRGYFEYLKQTNQVDEIVSYAKSYYQQAHALTDQKDLWGAITKYSYAINIMPNFYEALDNRAFCFMDQGNFRGAIPDFEKSLEVNPDSFLATFSIGECYLKLEDYPNAKIWFEKAMAIDPNHPKPKEFLETTEKLMGKRN